MNRNSIIILLGALCLIGAGAWLVFGRESANNASRSPSADFQAVSDGESGDSPPAAPPPPPPLPFKLSDPKPVAVVQAPGSDQELVEAFATACRDRKDTLARQLGREIVDRGAECLGVARSYFEALPLGEDLDAMNQSTPLAREYQGFAFVLAHLREDKVRELSIDYLRSVWVYRKELDEVRKAKLNTRAGFDAPWMVLPGQDAARMDVLHWHMRIVERVPDWVPQAIEGVARRTDSADPWASALYRNAAVVQLVKDGLARTATHVLNTNNFGDGVKRQVRALYVQPPKDTFELADQLVLLTGDSSSVEELLRELLANSALSAEDLSKGVSLAADRMEWLSASRLGIQVSAALASNLRGPMERALDSGSEGEIQRAYHRFEQLLLAFMRELEASLESEQSSAALMRPLSAIARSIREGTIFYSMLQERQVLTLELADSDFERVTSPKLGAHLDRGEGAVSSDLSGFYALAGLSTGDPGRMANRFVRLWERWEKPRFELEMPRVYGLACARVRLNVSALEASPTGTASLVDALLAPELTLIPIDAPPPVCKFHASSLVFLLDSTIRLLKSAGIPPLNSVSQGRLREMVEYAEEHVDPEQEVDSTSGLDSLAAAVEFLRSNGYIH